MSTWKLGLGNGGDCAQGMLRLVALSLGSSHAHAFQKYFHILLMCVPVERRVSVTGESNEQ